MPQLRSRTLLVVAAWAWIALCGLWGRAQAAAVHDLKGEFSFSLPSGYEVFAQDRGAPNLLYSYARGKPGDGSFALLQITSMGGTIGREDLIRETVERAAHESVKGTGIVLTHFEYRKTRWKTFLLDLVVTSATHDGHQQVILGTTVPVAKDAVQINLLGPAADEPKLLADMEELLASFDGKTNWLTSKERSERLGGVIGLGGGAVIALAIGLRRLRRQLVQAADG